MKDVHANFEKAVELLLDCFRSGHKLLLCGNGGSAADCAHILGELVKGFCQKRPFPRNSLLRLARIGRKICSRACL